MSFLTLRRLVPLAAAILSAVCFTSAASAATGASTFGCRASVNAVRPSLGLPAVEPYVANRPETPCVTDSTGAGQGTTGPTAEGSVATAGPGAAYTYSSSSAPQTTGGVAPGVTALASVDGGTIDSGTNSVVLPGPAQAQATYRCANGQTVPSASSNVSAVTINGKTTTPSSPGAQQTTQLGGGSYVTINQQVQTANTLTERLVFVHMAGVADYVLGEAQVTTDGAGACAGTTGGGGGNPPTLGACPPGSTLIAGTQLCEIIAPGGNLIVVSRPFDGPTGGRVVALSVARKKYKSGCLYGPGPKYAVVGTNKANRINGTPRADRIIGLGGNDRIATRGGNDCIDGDAGNDHVYGGKGKDRIYGGPGNDRLSVQNGSSTIWGGPGKDRIVTGNGNDHVYGGPGNDSISVGRGQDRVNGGAGNDRVTAGNGNDWVWGNAGSDSIRVGNGKDHLFGGAGNDRLFGPGPVVYESCGTGQNVAFANTSGMSYASRHGCQRVRKIHVRTL
jgi:Ca2+-binding RTX toxin-like protein